MMCIKCDSNDLELEEGHWGQWWVCCNKCDWVMLQSEYIASFEPDEHRDDQGVKPLIISLWCAKQTIWLYYFVYTDPKGATMQGKICYCNFYFY